MATIETKTVATLDLSSRAELFLYLIGADWHQHEREVSVGTKAVEVALSFQKKNRGIFGRVEEEFTEEGMEAIREEIKFEMALAKEADEIKIPFLKSEAQKEKSKEPAVRRA